MAVLRPQQEERITWSRLERTSKYLRILEVNLRSLESQWDNPPTRMPPKFRLHDGTIHQVTKLTDDTNVTVLSMRRLLIRVVTGQSEVLARMAGECRFFDIPDWTKGADLYSASLERIHTALSLADAACAQLWLETHSTLADLQADAGIVEVAVKYLTEERDKYRRAAELQADRLRQKLEPQWKARDEAKARIGEERWKNNPRPKLNHAAARRALERQLRDIEVALQQLDLMDLPTNVKDRYQEGRAVEMSENGELSEGRRQRYNGMRPTDLSKRVSAEAYPDPTDLGWTFTGSWNNAVEFFEQRGDDEELVKLDWYFTTATVKTSLDHPTQGRTQLFGAAVTPQIYTDILQNPRAHTNVRYQRRNGGRGGRGRGRGRGSRGRGGRGRSSGRFANGSHRHNNNYNNNNDQPTNGGYASEQPTPYATPNSAGDANIDFMVAGMANLPVPSQVMGGGVHHP